MVHTSYLPDWRLPSSWWTILYIPAACQICANNVFGGILKVTECIKEFDKSLFLDSVNSFLRFEPERIWKIMIFSAPSVSCPFLSHSSSPSVWYWDLYFFSSEIATLEQMFPPFPGGRWFLSDKTVFVWRKHNLLLSFESRILMNSDYRAAWAVYHEPIKEECIPTVQNYSVFIHYGDRIIWLIMTGNAIWWQSGLKTVTESDDFSTFGHLTRICRSVRILWQSDFSSMLYPYIPVFLFLYVLMFLCWGNGMSIY